MIADPLCSGILNSSQDDDGILRLTLNDPARRNALSEAMLVVIEDAIDAATVDPTVRVIIIAAVGSTFCAGHELKELTKAREDNDRGRSIFKNFNPMFQCYAENSQLPEACYRRVGGV